MATSKDTINKDKQPLAHVSEQDYSSKFFGCRFLSSDKPTSVVGIDPGTYRSAAVRVTFMNGTVDSLACLFMDNAPFLDALSDFIHPEDLIAIEMISPRGSPVGSSVFLTCLWIGRIVERYHKHKNLFFLTRPEISFLVCAKRTAKDSEIRAKLLAEYRMKFDPPQKLSCIKYDLWSALAIAHSVALIDASELEKRRFHLFIQQKS